jgi:F-type H+-transporting ATPase subunit gamma
VYGGGESVAIVGVASNSSLCGAFNINVIHKVQEVVEECRRAGESVEVISVGRKMAEAMRKAGFAPEDNADLVGRNSFEKSSAFAQTLIDGFNSGRYSRVLLIYNHFVSTASQKVCVETYLPFAMSGGEELPTSGQEPEEYILEPSREEILATLLPQVMRLRVHTVLLDSIAAEHAARTLAMQAASDNAEDLLGELTLEYNKGRQQKITAEILDLVGGAQQ